jgi:3-oxoacyl-[acyl-carrier-protein] synthase-3
MPIYYLNFLRLLNKVLMKASLETTDIAYFIYSNLSRTDREGFVRALGLPDHKVITTGLADLGHTFASDLVINYTNLRRSQPIEPGQFLLFASAGIGFTWGVTLARA